MTILRSGLTFNVVVGVFILTQACSLRAAAAAEGAAAPPTMVSANGPDASPKPTPVAPAPADEKGGAAAAGGGTAKTEIPTPEKPTPEPTIDAARACKKAMEELGNGKSDALNSLPPKLREAVVPNLSVPNQSENGLTCLAIAEHNNRYCDSLSKEAKAKCLDQFEFVTEIGKLPPESVKSHVIYWQCEHAGEDPKADCEALQEAMIKHNPAQCQTLSKAGSRSFCAALASGDAAQCAHLDEGDQRALCTALVTNDASRCPKGASDCRYLIQFFVTLKSEGMQGAKRVEPLMAAASQGKKACAPLLADLERLCREGR